MPVFAAALLDQLVGCAGCPPADAHSIVRNRGTLVGSLCHADPQGDWASVVTALGGHVVAQGPGGRRTIPMADFVIGPFQNALAYDEVAVEAVIPAPTGTRAGGYLKLERRVGDFATAGVAVAIETPGQHRPGRDRPDRRRRLHHRRPRRRRLAHRARLDAPTIARAAEPPPRPPGRGPTTAAARRTRARRAHLRHPDPDPRLRTAEGQADMTSLFDEVAEPAGRRRPGTPGDHHRQRPAAHGGHRAAAAAGPPAASGPQADRHPHRLRHHQLRRLHGAVRRQGGEELHHVRGPGRRPRGDHRRGPRRRRASCTRSRRGSSTSTACSAASARRG